MRGDVLSYEREQPQYDDLDERITETGDPAGDDLDVDVDQDDAGGGAEEG